ncbi:variable large family protein [Borreliella carolinensis]|uniref:variable large family protein n=1 Tax=Borreliella carolinensis TaxID=478174 RepID=UPI003AF1DDA4
MKKISSAIMLGTILFFINCSNAGDTAKDDPTNKFYQSVIQLGNGFLDVFTSFGGLVADALGFKADPKKSEVKTYFDSLAKKLEETKTDLNKLTKMNNEEAPKGSNEKSGNGKSVNGIAGGAVESAIKEISGWLEEMAKAAKVAADAATGGADKAVGNVVKAAANTAAAKGGEATSVNGIAGGIKGIVAAAEKAGEAGKLNVAAATGEQNADAGKLFAKKDNDGGDSNDAGKAAAAGAADAVGNVVKAANNKAAQGGEATSVNGIANGIKGIVDAAEKAGEAGKLNVVAAAGDGNTEAGKLFAKKKDNDKGGGDDKDAGKAAAAATGAADAVGNVVNAKDNKAAKGGEATSVNGIVSGIKGIVDAAEKAGEAGKLNVAAATGEQNTDAGKLFANKKDNDGGDNKAAGKAAAAATGAADAVGNVVNAKDNKAAKGGEATSVNGIVSGIKGIVDAAEKAGEAGKLNVAAATGEQNADAGKLFANKKDDNGGGDGKAAGKAAAAVSAVSGEKILKAIVDAAGGADKAAVEDVKDAKNPIEAAIGSTEQNKAADAFTDNGMKKDDQIAAAIVLRGMAKDGEFALKNADHGDHKGTMKNAVESAVKEISGWLEEMAKAAKVAAGAATGGAGAVGNVVKAAANTAAKGGEAKSVNGIADGIKGIVAAAEKAGEAGKLNVVAATGDGNTDAGKLFAKKNNEGGDSNDAGKAAAAVSAVSGEQILKAIVDAAGGADKAAVADVKDATNPIAAAIGSTGEQKDAAAAFAKDGMKKDDQIAAAIVLRGMAKDGEFALKDADDHKGTVKNAVESAIKEISGWLEEMARAAKVAAGAATGGAGAVGNVVKAADKAAKGGEATSVNGIANGIKGIVDAAEKAGEAGKLNVAAATGEQNADAGKLFAKKKNNDDGGGDDKAAGKAAAAVSAVSGEQILKAIVDAAGGADKAAVADVKDATNPIAAAIGSKDDNNAEAFTDNGMKKDDQIAAAIVLRGMAKDGEFALKNEAAHGDHEGTVKNAVESAIKEISGWLEEMAKAAKVAAGAATGGADAVGNVVKAENNKAAKGGEEKSVNGIADGIKGIVAAAEKAGEAGKLNVVAATGEQNADAGKLFANKKDDDNGGGDSNDAGKAAAAVSAVSGEQILKAIVDAAEGGAKAAVADVKDAKNPIAAAIGSKEEKAAEAFEKMKKDDQIAAAIVLRGMAKDGEFALKNAAHGAHKGTVKNAVESAIKEISGWLEEMAKAAKVAADAATGGADKAVGNVVKAKDNKAKGGEATSVNGIADGIKGIVDAAEKAGEAGKLNVVAAAGAQNADAGKLFANKKNNDEGGGDDKAAGKAAAAVSAVSGEQILKAIVDAAKGGEKAAVDDVKDATNPIAAAIGSTEEKAAAAFANNGMKKDDQIAAAIVLRGMAKDGEFALKNAADDAHKGTVKNAVESAAKEISGWLEEMAKAAKVAADAATGGAADAVGNVVKAAANKAAKGGEATSVNGIANGIKGIVDAAEKAGEAGKLNVVAAAGDQNADAGKLFAKKKDDNGGGDDKAAGKAAAAVSAVSGEQILKAIVDAAGGADKAAGNVVKAKENKAVKGGEATSVNGIAGGIKGIVDAAEKAGEAGKLNVVAAAGTQNAEAGKLFAKKKNNDDGGGDDKAAGKAAAAVSAVSGEQILKAIVDAAGGADKAAVDDVKDATNPIAAAIGSTGEQDAEAFTKDGMKKDDQIAAAIVLRGMAKDGEFALKDADHGAHKGTVKNAVESAIKEISGWLEEMAKAAKVAADAATGGAGEAVGNVVKAKDNKATQGGEETSVNGIANGIKGIVDAAEKAGEAGKLNVVAAAGDGNADAGKLFAKKKDDNEGGDGKAAGKAAAAVSAVSGEQILKAIVDAAKGGAKAAVADVKDATNPIAAAIGSTEEKAAAAFATMKKDDQIAAAIVLRGMAKDGEFALKNDAHGAHKGTVKNAVESAIKEISGWLEEMAKAAKVAADAATGGADKAVGNVVKAAVGKAAQGGEEKSVNGIANGIKGIVDAAEKAGEAGKLNVVAAAGTQNADAGKLFAKKKDNNGGGDGKAAGKAAAAVSAVSGEQILKAIVDAAGGADKAAVADVKGATNPIAAAIGSTEQKDADAAFAKDGMKKDDQIAAATVLRGMAKDGEFALKDADDHKGTVKNAVESAVKEISGWSEEMAKAAKVAADAATGAADAVGNVVKAEVDKAVQGGEEKSFNGIAGGIKGIVDDAEKAGEAGKLNVVAAAGAQNAEAGKLFAKKKDNNGGGDGKDAGKAAAAVSAVSGEQILKAIVDAAGGADKAAVADVKGAKNPIAAAIGSTGEQAAAEAFATMKKDDQIAAAIVLRGMAKDGEFALKDADHGAHKGTVKNAVESAVKEISGWLEEMAKAAKVAADAATGAAGEAVGNVVKAKNNTAAAKGGEEKSVNGIAGGIKGIVAAAEKAGEAGKLNVAAAAGEQNTEAGKLFAKKKDNNGGGDGKAAGKAAAAGEQNTEAGKLFAKKKDNNGGGDGKAAGKAAAAVSAVSGEQILKAIVDAAKGGAKAAVADVKDAKNPIAAAIGSKDDKKRIT